MIPVRAVELRNLQKLRKRDDHRVKLQSKKTNYTVFAKLDMTLKSKFIFDTHQFYK